MSLKLRKILLILFIWNLINKHISCRLKSTDFCILKQDINTISKCKNYQCGQILCSNNKESCDDLNIWSNTLNKYMFHLFKLYSIERIPTLLFSIFQSRIQDCKPTDSVSLNSQICLNLKKCKKNLNWSSRIMDKSSFYKISLPCPCSGGLKYDCGNMICSNSKETCDLANNLSKNYLENNINKCI
jgi:hypothetical protein